VKPSSWWSPNVDLARYYDELVRLMDRFPTLRVNLPHFGLHKNTGERLERLAGLLDRYPNLFVDTSFGHPTFQIAGFETLDATRERVAAFVTRYAHRIMFGVDLVVTAKADDAFVTKTMRSYVQLLEADRFRFFLRPERPMRGLALSDDVLRAVYHDTPAAFLKLHAAPKAKAGSRATEQAVAATKGS
jgi:hypothetical protein